MTRTVTIDSCLKDLSGQDFVVFAGSGVTGGTGVPGWGKLLERLCEEKPIPGVNVPQVEAQHYPEIAQMIFNKFDADGETEKYYELIEQELQTTNAPYSALQLGIAYATKHVITTNFEDSFEHAIKTFFRREDIQAECKYQSLPSISTDAMESGYSITYLHGRIDAREIVFRTADYERVYGSANDGNLTTVERYLADVFEKRTIVFVGFSFLDRYLRTSLTTIERRLEVGFDRPERPVSDDRRPRNHYAFLISEECANEDRVEKTLVRDLESIGISVIRYTQHKELVDFFARVETARMSPLVERLDA